MSVAVGSRIGPPSSAVALPFARRNGTTLTEMAPAMIFLGSDVAMRGSGLIGVDLFVKKFPAGVQKVLDILFKVIIAAFLCVLIYYGYGMTTSGWARQITSLHISYSWVTMAVPVGSFFMLISTIRNIIERVKTPAGQEVKHEAGRDVG